MDKNVFDEPTRGWLSPEGLLQQTSKNIEERARIGMQQRQRANTHRYEERLESRVRDAEQTQRSLQEELDLARIENNYLQQRDARAREAITHLLNRSTSLHRTIQHLAAKWSPDQIQEVEDLMNEELEFLEHDEERTKIVKESAETLARDGLRRGPHFPIKAERLPKRPKL